MFVRLWPILADFCLVLTDFSRVWPIWADVWPIVAEFGRFPPNNFFDKIEKYV